MFKRILITISLLIIASSATSADVSHQDETIGVSSVPPGGDFVLHSSQGEFSLKQLRGKVVLLYFGYTKCPDVCPTSLSIIAQALNELSEEELKSVQALFVSVDPKRDNFEVLDRYVSYFHPNLRGITGSEKEIAAVAKRYGAQYEEVALEGSSFGYSVNHSATTYLITPAGELRYVFPHETPAFVILEAIRYLLSSKGTAEHAMDRHLATEICRFCVTNLRDSQLSHVTHVLNRQTVSTICFVGCRENPSSNHFEVSG